MSPSAKRIISKGIGLYATAILQPTTPVAHLTRDVAIYAYPPLNPCCLSKPSPADLVFFTDASGESALMPVTRWATLQLTHDGGHYHMDQHRGHTTNGASLHGELEATADAVTRLADRPSLVCGGRHCRHTPIPPHRTTATPQGCRNKRRHPSTDAVDTAVLKLTPRHKTHFTDRAAASAVSAASARSFRSFRRFYVSVFISLISCLV